MLLRIQTRNGWWWFRGRRCFAANQQRSKSSLRTAKSSKKPAVSAPKTLTLTLLPPRTRIPPLPPRFSTSYTHSTHPPNPTASASNNPSTNLGWRRMEVEVKLRLPDAAAHQSVAEALAEYHDRTHLQENYFFDGAAGELASVAAALRVRLYDGGDARCVLSLKSRPRLVGGVSRVEEIEEDLAPPIARACLADPSVLASLPDSGIMRKIREEFGVGLDGKEVAWRCLGGFKNVRAVYKWEEGLVLELDETQYEFGTIYEVECEAVDPERAKEMIEAFLKEKGIPYSYAEASKFAVFRAGKLLP